MKKLIEGIMQFRHERRDSYMETFERLALGQSPDALFIACSDSRVAANVFASSDPGDLFVIRNVGNLVPAWEEVKDSSVAAAVDFSIKKLRIKNIIVCGHSDCGAMHALCQGLSELPSESLRSWLKHGEAALADLKENEAREPNQLSKRNVLLQMRRLKAYPAVQEAIQDWGLGIHGIWFDLHHLDLYYYEAARESFVLIDDDEGRRILSQLGGAQ